MEYDWCQRCGDKSNGKKFCIDCTERLEKYKKYSWKQYVQ